MAIGVKRMGASRVFRQQGEAIPIPIIGRELEEIPVILDLIPIGHTVGIRIAGGRQVVRCGGGVSAHHK